MENTNVRCWWKLHCTMEGSSKTKPSQKENPFGPFCYLLLWHLYLITETLNSTELDSRSCGCWLHRVVQGLPHMRAAFWKSFYMELRSHPTPSIWQAYWDSNVILIQFLFLGCTTPVSSTQLFKTFALTSNQTSLLTLPTTPPFSWSEKCRADLEISKIFTMNSTSGQSWRAWGQWRKSH